jgi:hypothetical protein
MQSQHTRIYAVQKDMLKVKIEKSREKYVCAVINSQL